MTENIANAKALYEVARVAHELNRAVSQSFGEPALPEWDALGEDNQVQLVEAVIFYFSNPAVTPEASHNEWLERGLASGAIRPSNPLAIPYAELPQIQRTKDEVFKAAVESLRPAYDMFYMRALMQADESDGFIGDTPMEPATDSRVASTH